MILLFKLPKPQELIGFISPLRKPLGFLVPIFEANGSFYVQEIDDYGCITCFILSRTPNLTEMVACPSPKALYVGCPAEYAFALSQSDIIFDDKESLSKELEGKIDELNEHPFLKLDVLTFLGKEDDYAVAFNEAAEELNGIDTAIAAVWKKNSE